MLGKFQDFFKNSRLCTNPGNTHICIQTPRFKCWLKSGLVLMFFSCRSVCYTCFNSQSTLKVHLITEEGVFKRKLLTRTCHSRGKIITPTRGGAHRFKSIAAFFRKAYWLIAALYNLPRVKRFSRTVFCHTKTPINTLAHNGRLYSQSHTVAIQ